MLPLRLVKRKITNKKNNKGFPTWDSNTEEINDKTTLFKEDTRLAFLKKEAVIKNKIKKDTNKPFNKVNTESKIYMLLIFALKEISRKTI